MTTTVCGGLLRWILAFLLVLSVAGPVLGRQPDEARSVAVVVSLRIRPYVESVDGLARELKREGVSFRTFYLDESGEAGLRKRLAANDFSAFVAVGPEAGRFLGEFPSRPGPVFFMMILNPAEVIGAAVDRCGVSLRIPVAAQIREIGRCLPEVKTVGVLFSSAHNASFVTEAIQSAGDTAVTIAPLSVPTPRQIPSVLKAAWNTLDALWLIPDRTVISESLVHFILKEALLQGVPVIGYNRFFYESGALISFVIDYEAVGRKTAQLLLSGEDVLASCSAEPPPYHIWLNLRVRGRLRVPTVAPGEGMVKAGP